MEETRMATRLVFLVALFVAVNSATIYAAENACSVIYDDKAKALHVVSGKQEPYVAQAVFAADSFNKTGYVSNSTFFPGGLLIIINVLELYFSHLRCNMDRPRERPEFGCLKPVHHVTPYL